MKKVFLILPVVISVLVTGCPSEPPPGITVEGNIKIRDGKLEHVFSEPVITNGKQYEVILSVQEISSTLVDEYRLNGTLYYKNNFNDANEEPKMLAGRLESARSTLVSAPRDYKWTFTAGDQHLTHASLAECVNPATTPVGATQYFLLELRRGDNKVTGSIEGTLIVREKTFPSGTLQFSDTIVINSASEIKDASFTKVQTATAGSVLRFFIDCPLLTEFIENSSTGGPRPGWGIGYVGNFNPWNSNEIIHIPVSAEPGTDLKFEIDLLVSNCLDYRGTPSDGWLFTNIFHNCKITKCELWEYK